MHVEIRINCDNASFSPAPYDEVARILHDLANKIERNGMVNTHCLDANGNIVGELLALDVPNN